ncbi:DedA family protein [Desulfotomaculum varum]
MIGLTNFFETVWQWLTTVISALGYWGVAVGMALESANIPLPSEVILPFGGYLVFCGRLDFWWTVLAGTLGGTFGSVASYYLGRLGGRPFLEKYGRYLGLNRQKLMMADRWFARYGEATVFFTRLMPIVRTFISLPAGIAGMNLSKFVIYTVLGSLPWSILLVYAGYVLGENWQAIKPWFHRADVVVVILLGSILVYCLYRKQQARR